MTDLRLPLAVKVPLVVMAFMAMVAIFVSERVLARLAAAQTRHLEDLAAVHLDGLATALIDPVIREDVWEIFDVLDRARQRHAGLKPTATVVATR
ncbi:MAG TPA: sensor histidine kinase, partial [Microvirga sp.]|nr:sensor histidine kinase [Microvirga sp.]